ncbi:hypothetical protein C4553_02685 [Candidatus Parcubacteria bacterium]|nr:MAG: hypothetical protein C4553_02685 [Candidatus Parcubacteria bacterium]
MKGFISEIIVALILIILSVLLLDTFSGKMPDQALMATVGALVVVFAVFASFIWREKAQDEREQLHLMIAGRVGFLVGSAVLVLGIVIQSVSHKIDLWLVVALIAMIAGKLIALAYNKIKN